jgi:hypothetical protein
MPSEVVMGFPPGGKSGDANMLMSRGDSRKRMGGCGCTLRAMVAVSDEGDMQALVCSDPAISGAQLCLSCQHICRTLNALLERCTFSQAVRLTPDNLDLEAEAKANLSVALSALHEALAAAILEFESMVVPAEESRPLGQYGELVGAYA